MADSKATPPGPPQAEAPESSRSGWLSWLVGWVLVPSLVIGGIFGGGVLFGAHYPDGWFARAVAWVVAQFA